MNLKNAEGKRMENHVKFAGGNSTVLSARYKISKKLDWQENEKQIRYETWTRFRKKRWIRESKIPVPRELNKSDPDWTSSSEDEEQGWRRTNERKGKVPLPRLENKLKSKEIEMSKESADESDNSTFQNTDGIKIKTTCASNYPSQFNLLYSPIKYLQNQQNSNTINRTLKRLQRKQLVTQISRAEVSKNLFKYPEIPQNQNPYRFEIKNQPRMKALRKISTSLNDFSEKNMRNSIGFGKQSKNTETPKVINPYITSRNKLPLETFYKLASPYKTEQDFFDPTILQETLGYYIKPEYEEETFKFTGLSEWINSIKIPEYLHPEDSVPKINSGISKNSNSQLDENKFRMYFKRVVKKYPLTSRSRYLTLSPK